jgi:hypothetical protein
VGRVWVLVFVSFYGVQVVPFCHRGPCLGSGNPAAVKAVATLLMEVLKLDAVSVSFPLLLRLNSLVRTA